MTSLERREVRFQRRKAKREQKRKQLDMYRDYSQVFSFDNLYESSRKCRLGIRWKPSTQRYLSAELKNVSNTFNLLNNNIYKSLPFSEFDICERGKHRHISSLHIKDRVVQKCLCDNCLIPLLRPKLIYDNGACLKDRGITFSRNRLKCHLEKYYRKFGNEGYILTFDFKGYFDSIPHQMMIDKIRDIVKDSRITETYGMLVRDFGNDKGLGLGSQISQISALFYLNDVDHYIKENLKIKYYARYMDDGYLIHKSKSYLRKCLSEISLLCDRLEIKLNIKKTHIVKLRKGFVYLKQNWTLLDNGKILRKVSKDNLTRQRRKLKKLKAKFDNGLLPRENIVQSQNSWESCLQKIDSFIQIKNMRKIFATYFGGN